MLFLLLARLSQRGRTYAARQHDIDNHLLVISGLLREKSFARAERYASRLKSAGKPPGGGVSTGNPAVDVLLEEKLDAARRGHIAVEQDVRLRTRVLLCAQRPAYRSRTETSRL